MDGLHSQQSIIKASTKKKILRVILKVKTAIKLEKDDRESQRPCGVSAISWRSVLLVDES